MKFNSKIESINIGTVYCRKTKMHSVHQSKVNQSKQAQAFLKSYLHANYVVWTLLGHQGHLYKDYLKNACVNPAFG